MSIVGKTGWFGFESALVDAYGETIQLQRVRHEEFRQIFDTSRTLDELFSRLIAAEEGIQPEEVTSAYIHRRRAERAHLPRFVLDGRGLKVVRPVTRADLEALNQRVDAALAKL